MKIDRLIAIIMMLINKRKVTAKELSAYFEVSVRTIQRDMDHLTMAGVPIYSDVGKNGGYQLLEDYKLDKNFLNVDEAKMLLSFLKNLETTVPYDEAKTISNKLSALLPKNDVTDKVIFKMNPMVSHARYRESMGVLTKARDQHLKIHMTYIDGEFKETTRIISPYRLVMMGSVWYVYAYCDERNDFRLFKISRIIESVVLKETFIEVPLPERLPWDMDLDSGLESVEMVLEIDSCLKGHIPDYFDYKSCKVLEDKIVIAIAFPVNEWLYSLLLSMVPHIKVVEPIWLQEEMVGRLLKGLEKMTQQ